MYSIWIHILIYERFGMKKVHNYKCPSCLFTFDSKPPACRINELCNITMIKNCSSHTPRKEWKILLARVGIEPTTFGFVLLCSTDWAMSIPTVANKIFHSFLGVCDEQFFIRIYIYYSDQRDSTTLLRLSRTGMSQNCNIIQLHIFSSQHWPWNAQIIAVYTATTSFSTVFVTERYIVL